MTGNQTHFHKPNDSAEGTNKKDGLEGPRLYASTPRALAPLAAGNGNSPKSSGNSLGSSRFDTFLIGQDYTTLSRKKKIAMSPIRIPSFFADAEQKIAEQITRICLLVVDRG
jgi:hypothetical protein